MVIVYIEGAPLAVAEQTWRRLTRFLRAALVSDFAPNLDVRTLRGVLFYLDFQARFQLRACYERFIEYIRWKRNSCIGVQAYFVCRL